PDGRGRPGIHRCPFSSAHAPRSQSAPLSHGVGGAGKSERVLARSRLKKLLEVTVLKGRFPTGRRGTLASQAAGQECPAYRWGNRFALSKPCSRSRIRENSAGRSGPNSHEFGYESRGMPKG